MKQDSGGKGDNSDQLIAFGNKVPLEYIGKSKGTFINDVANIKSLLHILTMSALKVKLLHIL